MFKAAGNIKGKRLQEHVDILGAKFKVSVVTGPSGSYREGDMLRFLAKWWEPWSGTRKWEFILLDAYAPGLTNNVQRLCWSRGYIVVTHGGGASMILQTNDVLLHKEVRKQFIELQTAFLLGKTRNIGGGLVDCTHEESLDLMIQVMSDRNLHLNGAKAYKHTGTTLAFDGTEDGELRNDARGFWHRLGMRKKIDAAVKEVEDAWKAGTLRWNYKSVQSLITPYPARGELDVLKPGMEDEATSDPEGLPWAGDEQQEANDEGDAFVVDDPIHIGLRNIRLHTMLMVRRVVKVINAVAVMVVAERGAAPVR